MGTLPHRGWVLGNIKWNSKHFRPQLTESVEVIGQVTELVVISCYSIVIWQYKVDASFVYTTQIACLGASVGLLAIAYRGLGRASDFFETKSPLTRLVSAALSTAAAVFTALLFCRLLLPIQIWERMENRARWWALVTVLSSAAVHYLIGVAMGRIGGAPRVAIICARNRADYVDRVFSTSKVRNEISRFVDDEDLSPLLTAAENGTISLLLLAMAEADGTRIGEICDLFADLPVRVCLAIDPATLGVAPPRSPFLLLDLVPPPLGLWAASLKRLVDIIGSVVALILTLPLLVIAVVAIRLETDGPALFRQWRSGKGGRPFEVLKLRTMYYQSVDSAGEQPTAQRDPRITRVGRFLRHTSIDELPQLINVLRGQMSLVGPRAHPVHMKIEGRSFADVVKNYRVRHRIKPGITGWAQINGSRGGIEEIASAERRVELDLFYVHNFSFLLDFYIIIRTVCGGFIVLH